MSGLIPAIVSAAPSTVAVILAFIQQQKKLDQIHVLVNSRLTQALAEIESLKSQISKEAPSVPNELAR